MSFTNHYINEEEKIDAPESIIIAFKALRTLEYIYKNTDSRLTPEQQKHLGDINKSLVELNNMYKIPFMGSASMLDVPGM